MRELLIGAGNARRKKLWNESAGPDWHDLTTLDIDPRCNPDVLWDLNRRPLPFEDGAFSEIHAYEVLEHLGRQGDWRGWFDEWNEYYRLLQPGGLFAFSSPRWDSPWAWGDPGHTRVIMQGTLSFLSQDEYARQVGHTTMTDYRDVYYGDFALVHVGPDGEHSMLYGLQRL